MKRFALLFIIAIIGTVTSCEKDDLTLPADVNFEFSMNPYMPESELKAGQGFTIDEGRLVINSIEFDGQRDEGEDYYFSKKFDTPLEAELHTKELNQDVHFDIPQGIYNSIDISFYLGEGAKDGLFLNGTVQKGPFEEVPIQFEYAAGEVIRIKAKNNGEADVIALKKGTPSKASVIFDAEMFFRFVNVNMIMNAETTSIDGVETIVINEDYNNDIFSFLIARMPVSMRVIFEDQ